MDFWLILYALIFLFAIPRVKWYRQHDPLFEYYNITDTGTYTLYGVNWRAQTFTVGSTPHTVTSVKVLIFRTGSPAGSFILSIRATDGSGHPTGSDLTSGSVTANTLPTSKTWIEIAVTSYLLSASTKYGIVCRAPNGDASNYVTWRAVTTGTYAGGNLETSTNSGSTWTAGTADLMFEVWGEYPTAPPTDCSVSILTETSLRVSWTDASTDEDDFHVERKTGAGGTYAEVQIVSSTTKASTGTVYTWDNSGLLISTTYYYKVRAHNHTLNIYSDYSNEAYNTTPFYAPTNLVAVSLNIDAILVQWADNSQNESDYHLERKTSLEPTWAERTILPANSTQFTDPGLDSAVIYTYRVRAHNHPQDIYTTYSNEASEAPKLLAQIPFNPFTPLLGYY